MSTERYVSFESLLLTDRVVARSGRHLRISEAGYNPKRVWIECVSTKIAKRAGGSLLIHLREKRARGECKTDSNYNRILYAWLEQLEEGGYLVARDTAAPEEKGTSEETNGSEHEDGERAAHAG